MNVASVHLVTIFFMDNIGLLKQTIKTKGKANLCFSGRSMYPTLKDSMKLTIANISPAAITTSDIIAYQENNTIVAHRVIDLIRNNDSIKFITKGDNQPFGGISYVKEKDLIGKVESAFYPDHHEENILIKNRHYGLLYVWLGRAFLIFRKIKRYIPEFIRIYLKYLVNNFYFLLGKFA